ncbi:MAG: hypothetical protein Q7S06_00710 [Nanoarchaeota archaeon]|nr:hypothetical protein [Nanoarchaeota archaeon]
MANGQPRRKIHVGLDGYLNAVGAVPGRMGDSIYVQLVQDEEEGIITVVKGISDVPFTWSGVGYTKQSLMRIQGNPCHYVEQNLAITNNCEVDYSPAIQSGLKLSAQLTEARRKLTHLVTSLNTI